MNVRRLPAWVPYALLAAASCAPLFVVERPPLQDLPLHMAATRVIHDLHDATYGFDGVFQTNLGQTQYVLYHVLASVLAYVVGVSFANRLLLCAYLGGTILATRYLLQVLGRDERLCVFVGPLLVNIMFIFGLAPFLFAIPFMVLGTALVARYYENPTWTLGAGVAVLSIAMFYLHVFPLGLFGLAALALFPWTKPRRWFVAAAPGLPVAALIAWWSLATSAGKLARGAILHPAEPSPLSPWGKLLDSFNWLGDTFRDHSDEVLWGVVFGLVIVSTIVAVAQGKRWSWRMLRYALVPGACVFLFCVTGEHNGNIWLIWQRFPLLFCLTMVPLFDVPKGWPGRVVTSAAVAVALAVTINTCIHFRRFQRDDVADFDDALAQMEPRKHVIGLIYWKESSVTWRHPFVHFVSYYQVEKGGVVEFTFAGFPHWPYHFAKGNCPPQGCQARLDWEWETDRVTMAETYPYFDYVLTRGDGFDPKDRYRKKWSGGPWAVWERRPN